MSVTQVTCVTGFDNWLYLLNIISVTPSVLVGYRKCYWARRCNASEETSWRLATPDLITLKQIKYAVSGGVCVDLPPKSRFKTAVRQMSESPI